MGVELVTDREKKTPATKTAALLVKRYRFQTTPQLLNICKLFYLSNTQMAISNY